MLEHWNNGELETSGIEGGHHSTIPSFLIGSLLCLKPETLFSLPTAPKYNSGSLFSPVKLSAKFLRMDIYMKTDREA